MFTAESVSSQNSHSGSGFGLESVFSAAIAFLCLIEELLRRPFEMPYPFS